VHLCCHVICRALCLAIVPATVMSRAHTSPSLVNNSDHQHEEHHENQHKRQHHPDALRVAALYDFVVGLNVPLAVLWALTNRPQLAIPVAGRRLVQLAVWRLECVDLCVGIVANAFEALGEPRRVLWWSVCCGERVVRQGHSVCGVGQEARLTSSLSLYAIAYAVSAMRCFRVNVERKSVCKQACAMKRVSRA
jgi:hypothetical protein